MLNERIGFAVLWFVAEVFIPLLFVSVAKEEGGFFSVSFLNHH